MIGLLTVALLAAAPENPQVEPPSPAPLPEPELTPLPPNIPPEVPPEPAATASDDGEHLEKEGPGGQFGAVGLLGANVQIGVRTSAKDPLGPPSRGAELESLGGIAGIGLRYGFFQRELNRQGMPAVAALIGTGFSIAGFTPFVEGRMEYLTVSEGGPLQPNFTVYGLTGLSLNPLGGNSAFGVRPHVGFGIGWNWLPKGGGGGGGWSGWNFGNLGGGGGGLAAIVAIPIALGIVAMIFAGRLEVRYTARPLLGPGNDFVSVTFGVGG